MNCLILAAGPSRNKVDFSLYKDWTIVTINYPCEHANILVFCDGAVKKNAINFNGEVITTSEIGIKRPATKYMRGHDYRKEPPFMVGRSTTIFALQIFLYRGYTNIHIAGLDMGEGIRFYEDKSTLKRRNAFKLEADCWMRAVKMMSQEDRDKVTLLAPNPWPFASYFKMIHE